MKRVHFVGIKGVAMAALAVWYKEAGYKVSGSDTKEEFPTDEVLGEAHIVVQPFGKLPPCDFVIYTGAHGGQDNPEVIEAMKQKIPVFPHGKALGEVMKGKKQISVAGSHGKTTTSAMIATILSVAGRDPSWAIGCGEIRGLGLPGHFGRGDLFVAEADEYITDPGHDMTPRFLWQKPDILVITNIDWDHPDVYATLSDVATAFKTLESQSKIIITHKDFQVTHVAFGQERTFFSLEQNGMKLGDFTLKVPGIHNTKNAGEAVIACMELGVSREKIAEGLLMFGGTKRRFEFVGTRDGVKIIDDYAHHPKEIKATIAAAREWYPKQKIIVVFQPHTYSRTKALMGEFSKAFNNASMVLLTDIYSSARETDTLGITGKTLVEETAKHHPNVLYAPDFPVASTILHKYMQSGDIIIFMGAGDIYGWSKRFIEK